jgi:hypothetical protein
MKPKFTDLHRFPNGYRKAVDTDVAETIRRAQKRIELAKEAQAHKITSILRRKA